MLPAVWTAANSSCTRKPSAAPIATSVTAVTSRKPAVGSGRPGAIRPYTVTASAIAIAPLTGAGMALELNGGASRTKPVPRAVPSTRATSVAVGTWRSMATSGPPEQMRQHVEQLVGERDQLGQRPVAGQQQRDRHGDDLGDERQRRFLDLRGRLEQRDQEADQQRGQQHRRGHLGCGHHRADGDLRDFHVGHVYAPTSSVVIIAQPSTTTNNSSLNGSDTIDGETIIMPIDINPALTSMSSTRNGM